MKPSVICAMAALAISFSSCATEKGGARNCPELDISYVSTAPNAQGNLVGIFSITNNGNTAVDLPLESQGSDLIHGRYAFTEQRPSTANKWQAFNPLLEEMLAPSAHMTIAPKQRGGFRFDANGLFLDSPGATGMEYSVVIKDVAGCTFRSAPFRP